MEADSESAEGESKAEKQKYGERRRKLLARHTALKTERSSWDAHWREISEQIDPRRSRFLTTDRNRGDKKNQKIINNTPLRAKATLAAGMQAGLTSQSRPWFRLTAPTPELAEVAAVKEWLHTVEERLREVMARSNIYNGFHTLYGDEGEFGTAVMYIEEDDQDVIRVWVFPIGSYCLELDSKGRVCAVFRETSFTVAQLVEEFGLEKCSEQVQQMFNNVTGAQKTQSVNVLWVIEPNEEYEPRVKFGPQGKKYSSSWFELNGNDETGFLREAGYDEFPCMGPRWAVTGEDTYGSSPGMEALGDCRALQLYEKRSAQAFDKVVSPPMTGPASLNQARISLLPGDGTYTDTMSPGNAFRPAHEVNPQALPAFEAKIAVTERRINSAFYADLWLALTQQEGTMTAREVGERHEEKMLQLGPVTERLQDELHDPCIDRIFGCCLRRGIFPPAPEELAGANLKVEYISTMAQAQKMLGTSAIERLAAFVGNLAAAKPEVLDVIDFDQAVQEYANALGVPPSLIRTDDVLKAIRAAAQQAKQAQAQQQQLMTAAQGAETLSKADLQGDNALKRLIGGLGGVAGASAPKA